MKTHTMIISIMIMCSCIQAQNPTTSTTKIIEEAYLAEILENPDIIYSRIEAVDDFFYVKNMLVVFTIDSTHFVTAYLESNYYDAIIASYCRPFCTYIELDDIYGNQLKLRYEDPIISREADEESLNNLTLLRPVLDDLLQRDTCDYSRDTRIFLDID